MKKILFCAFILALTFSINSCNLINNTSNPSNTTYVNKTATFTNALLDSNYAACVDMINLDKSQNSVAMSVVKVGLDSLKAKISRNFGRRLEYSFMNVQKQASNDMSYNLPPNTTLVSIEFHNSKDIGVLQVLFDDLSGKIDNIQSLQVRQPIPNMTKFWLFGLLALLVVAFNIFAIIAVWRSKLKLKWLYCIAILLVNIPSIEYGAAHGLAFRPWRDQYLIGVDFQKIGYLGSFWTIGIPVAAIITICRIFFFKPKVVTAAEPTKPANKKPLPAKDRGTVK